MYTPKNCSIDYAIYINDTNILELGFKINCYYMSGGFNPAKFIN